MPVYQLSNVVKQYDQVANPPALDKVCFTIDHIHKGSSSVSSTLEVVKFLTNHNIPVVVFFQCRDPRNPHRDKERAEEIYALAPNLVSLGVHSLSKGNSQAAQTKNLNVLNKMIQEITGRKSVIMSYHGAGAGAEPTIHYSGIQYSRGIQSSWAVGMDDPLETPVMPLRSVRQSFEYTVTRNAAGLTSTLFVHSGELGVGSLKRRIFDTYVKAVMQRKLQAVSYLDAMRADFRRGSHRPTEPSSTFVPPARGDGPDERGVFRLSASSDPARRPIKANFSITNVRGQQVAAAQNTHSKAFNLAVGSYKVTAKKGRVTQSAWINLTTAGGIHKIFLMRT